MKFSLVLHFDINKTILISDQSTGISQLQLVNSLVSEQIWGLFNVELSKEKRTVNDWKILSSIPSFHPPNIQKLSSDCLATFGTYLEDHTLITKSERKRLKTTFTETGKVGEVCQPWVSMLLDSLKLPSPPSSSSNDQSYYNIIPSFFYLIDSLYKHGIDFRIIFRTFGIDLSSTVVEFNEYCEGKHSVCKPTFFMDGTSQSLDDTLQRDLRLKLPDYSGVLLRDGKNANDVRFAHVNSDQKVSVANGHHAFYIIFYEKWLGLSPSDHGSSIQSNSVATYSVAIQDDYLHWEKEHESDKSGKLLLINAHPSSLDTIQSDDNPRLIQIFFDDNIEHDRAHIVDVREWDTFDSIDFMKAKDELLCIRKVDTMQTILNQEYFVNEVEQVLGKYGFKIK